MTAINELLSNNRAYADGLDAGPHRDVRPSRLAPAPAFAIEGSSTTSMPTACDWWTWRRVVPERRQ